MIINTLSKRDKCTGCSACYNICPMHCITMQSDCEGFLYPAVDTEKCIACRQCERVCPTLHSPIVRNSKEPDVYAGWSLDDQIRYESTSGGIFSELAKIIVKENGFVVGASYNSRHLVEHQMISTESEIVSLRQSKYIQSEIRDVYKYVKTALSDGKTVAFCGSPCQIAGLLNFLDKKYDNLVTIDFVCRGINSPYVYLKYLESLEAQYESAINSVWFKYKKYGWNRFSTKVVFETGVEYIKDRYHDWFMKGYIDYNLYMRPCCFKCRYKSFPRLADITLGDFWGLSQFDDFPDADKGTSLIMINSRQGKELLEKTHPYIYLKKEQLKFAIAGNPALIQPAYYNAYRKQFFEDINVMPFDLCVQKYSRKSWHSTFQKIIFSVKNKVKRLTMICK